MRYHCVECGTVRRGHYDSHSNTNTDTNTDTNSYTNSYPNTDADPNTNADPNTGADRFAPVQRNILQRQRGLGYDHTNNHSQRQHFRQRECSIRNFEWHRS